MPSYNGEKTVLNLDQKVVVYYDDNGVPHIEASNQKDAYKALGYVHAQDRLWQMELMRRITAGRLSEVFGKKTLRIDKMMGSLGVEEQTYKTIANLDKNSKAYQLTQAYLEGVNQFIKNGKTPIEFYLLGVNKEEYSLKDVYNVFGYMAFSFELAHRTDPLVNRINKKLGANYVNELNIPLKNTTLLKTTNKSISIPTDELKNTELDADILKTMDSIVKAIPVSQFTGSNSWVLGTERTQNGKVIFANDPHMTYSQPSVWYQNHIKTPNYEMYGFNLGLVPFPLLGHNKKYAYGLTMFLNDDVDFFVEQNNPDNHLEYQTENGYERYKVYEKTIKVKNGKDTVIKLKVSRHGPIINNLIEDVSNKKPVAMQWIYTKASNQLLDVAYGVSHSDSLSMFEKTASKLHAPGLNMMYGDSQNNIAWFGAAKLYTYRDSLNRKLFLDGASGKDEIESYIDFKNNPRAVNTKWGYVYSANNQPDSIQGMLYPGYYCPEDRAKRIEEIIDPKYDFTKKDVQKMIIDVKSAIAPEIIKKMVDAISIHELSDVQKKGLEHLLNWNGAYVKQDISPTIYTRFTYEFLKNTFADELGRDDFRQLLNNRYLFRNIFSVQIGRDQSVWWDDIQTKEVKETKKDIVTKSFKDAIKFLSKQLGTDMNTWAWSNVISVEYEHPLAKGGEWLRWFFNVGPFKTNGGNGVINKRAFKLDSTGYYKVNAGASTRRVIDFSDIENSKAILPTGQSGNRFSQFYKNQAELYLDGQFTKMIINPKEYRSTKNRLVFLPK